MEQALLKLSLRMWLKWDAEEKMSFLEVYRTSSQKPQIPSTTQKLWATHMQTCFEHAMHIVFVLRALFMLLNLHADRVLGAGDPRRPATEGIWGDGASRSGAL